MTMARGLQTPKDVLTEMHNFRKHKHVQTQHVEGQTPRLTKSEP